MKQIEDLKGVLVFELRDLRSAEIQLTKALPMVIKAASNEFLRDALSAHLNESQQHVERLGEIENLLGVRLGGETSEAMQALLKGVEEVTERTTDANLRDVMLIAAYQRIEHYEISGYVNARRVAEELSLLEVAELLETSLEEEAIAERGFTMLCEGELLALCPGEEARYDTGLRSQAKSRAAGSQTEKGREKGLHGVG